MKRILLVICLIALFAVQAVAAPLAGYEVGTSVPIHLRYQFYEGVGGATTLEINVGGDLGRIPMNGYVTNNGAATVYLHINYTEDSGDTMKKIKIPPTYVWNFSPANLSINTLEFTSAATIDIDLMVH